MKNRGIVREIHKNFIIVELFKDISCSHCNSCDKKTHAFQSFNYNGNDLKAGDIIEFYMDDKKLIRLGFLTYITPVIFMISFYFMATCFSLSEGTKIISSFLGLALNFLILYFLDKTKGNSILTNIKITKEKN